MSQSDFGLSTSQPAGLPHFDQIVINHRPPTVRSAPLPVHEEEEDNDPTPRPSVSSGMLVDQPVRSTTLPQRRHSSAQHGISTTPLDGAYRQRETHPTLFRAINWGSKKAESRESLKRQSPPGSSSSSTTSRRSQKESGLIRRISQRGNKLQKAVKEGFAPRSRPSSSHAADSMEGVEASAANLGFFTRLTGSKHLLAPSSSSSSSGKARYDTPAPVNNGSAPPSNRSQQPGEAARRTAATHNYETRRNMNRQRLHSISSAADSGADLGSNADVDMVDLTDSDDESFTASGCDPVKHLPAEIVNMIFSYLDANTLKACQQIATSRVWERFAKDHLTWRDVYLNTYGKQNYVTPAPIQIGGIGVGLPNQPNQDWEKMRDARVAVEKNWARGQGKAIYMAGHTDSVYCVQFDEHKIITGSRDRTIRVWDINTFKCIKVIGGPTVRPVPGPKVLRTVEYPFYHHAEPSINGTELGNSIYHVPSDFHMASILCLQYDDEILVTGSSDCDLMVWDIKTYEPIQRLKKHTGGVLDVAFDSKHIISCSKDCTIAVWDRQTLQLKHTLHGHRGPVNAVQLRGNLLVSASGDGVAKLWDLNKTTDHCIRDFPQKDRGLAAVEFSDDAQYVLAGGNDHITYKFHVATGAEVGTFTGHTQLVRSLFLDSQNNRVVSGSYDLDLRVYNFETGQSTAVFAEWTTSWMLAAKCDYRRIVSTSQDGRILLIDFGLHQDGQKIDGVDLLSAIPGNRS